VNEQKGELIQLRTDKVEKDSKLLFQDERIKQISLEAELKSRQASDLEQKLTRAN
jgi:hypothetical protein